MLKEASSDEESDNEINLWNKFIKN
jgi:hypothetical protein